MRWIKVNPRSGSTHVRHGGEIYDRSSKEVSDELATELLALKKGGTVNLFVETEEPQKEEEESSAPAGNAGKDEWYAYRLATGYTEEQLEDLGRDELRDLE